VKIFIRIIIGFFIVSMLLVMFGAIALRESLGGQYRFDYTSPSHSDYRAEIYEHAGMVGNPTFSLFVVDSGVRQYLGDFGEGSNSVWSEELFWSKDGATIFCGDKDCRVAYVFGKGEVRSGSDLQGPAELNALLREHGGRGASFFDYKFDPRIFIWRDFVPSENY